MYILRKSARPVLFIILSGFFSQAYPDSLSSSHTIDDILDSLTEHPFLQSRIYEYRAARDRARGAITYPDPEFMIERMDGNMRGSNVYPEPMIDSQQMTGYSYRITQPIPFPGKISLDAARDRSEERTSLIRLQIERNDFSAAFIKTLIDYHEIKNRLQLTEGFQRRASVLAGSARSRYGAGGGSLAEVSRASVQQFSFSERVEEQKAELEAKRSELIYFLSSFGSEQEILRYIDNESERRIDTFLSERQSEFAYSDLEQQSLEIALAKQFAETSRHERNRSRLDFFPDFGVFAGYSQEKRRGEFPIGRAQEESYSLGFTIRIPLWSLPSTGYESSSAANRYRSSERQTRNIEAESLSLYRTLQSDIAAIDRRKTILDNQILPQARRAYESAMHGYRAGSQNFANVLGAYDDLFDVSNQRIRLEAQRRTRVLQMAGLLNLIIKESDSDIQSEPQTDTSSGEQR